MKQEPVHATLHRVCEKNLDRFDHIKNGLG